MTGSILIVDDERNIRRTLQMVLEGENHSVFEAENTAAAFALARQQTIDVVLLDVRIGETESGLDLLKAVKSAEGVPGLDQHLPVIMISGNASIDDAVQATRLGAFDFLEKPLDRNRIMVTVRNALERRRMWQQVTTLKAAVDSRFELLGNSQVMQELRRHIAKVAPTKSRVLITGESGTGKELIARAIHRNSAVSASTFVKVNCAAIPPELIESELFGHEKGAFTGAVGRKRGLFEVANGGTIFLDEIGDMSLSAQAKVLRVLQTGDFNRVGGEEVLKTDARVVAATNKDLEAAVQGGTFREDLFFRLNVVPIASPPLRDRIDDLPLLIEAFIAECCDENGFSRKEVRPGVQERLQQYSWPGNVRELRNVIERMVIMSEEAITEADLPAYLTSDPSTRLAHKVPAGDGGSVDVVQFGNSSLREFRELVETAFIRFKLDQFEWNISRTAQALGIERTNLHKRMRALGIHRER